MLFNNLFQNRSSDSRGRQVKGWPQTRRILSRRSTFSPWLESLENRAMLTTFTVTSLDDAGEGSLRDAIDDANTNPGADIIEFAPAVQGTIGLTTGELEITDDVAINGPGQGKLTVNGSDLSRVFKIGSDADVDISHVGITDGFTTGIISRRLPGCTTRPYKGNHSS